MNLRMSIETRGRMFASAGATSQPAGRVLLAAALVLAGIGAAAAPLLADLMSATAGVLIVSLGFAAWTTAKQGGNRVGTTNLLGAV